MSRIFPVLIPTRARLLNHTLYVQAQTWYQAREKMQNINRAAVVGAELTHDEQQDVAYVDVDYGQFCRNVQIGRTRNGGEPVSVFTESDGRIFLAPDMVLKIAAE